MAGVRQKVVSKEEEKAEIPQDPDIEVYISLGSQQKIARNHIKQSQRDLASLCSSQIYSDRNMNRQMTEISKL